MNDRGAAIDPDKESPVLSKVDLLESASLVWVFSTKQLQILTKKFQLGLDSEVRSICPAELGCATRGARIVTTCF
jgi:hypothetical protein